MWDFSDAEAQTGRPQGNSTSCFWFFFFLKRSLHTPSPGRWASPRLPRGRHRLQARLPACPLSPPGSPVCGSDRCTSPPRVPLRSNGAQAFLRKAEAGSSCLLSPRHSVGLLWPFPAPLLRRLARPQGKVWPGASLRDGEGRGWGVLCVSMSRQHGGAPALSPDRAQAQACQARAPGPAYRAVAFDHFLLLLEPLQEAGERLPHGAEVRSQLVFFFQNLLDLSFSAFLLFLSLLLRKSRHVGPGQPARRGPHGWGLGASGRRQCAARSSHRLTARRTGSPGPAAEVPEEGGHGDTCSHLWGPPGTQVLAREAPGTPILQPWAHLGDRLGQAAMAGTPGAP